MTLYTPPFGIFIDTREQLPFTFKDISPDADEGTERFTPPTSRVALESGDYAVAGMVHLAAVERKSKEDFFGTVGQCRNRFERELMRLSKKRVALVVVESEWSEIWSDPPPFSKLKLKTLSRSVMAWSVRYPNVQWAFLPGRRYAETYTFRFLEKVFLEFSPPVERKKKGKTQCES